MSNPKVSIVIPIYEPTIFFSAALESIRMQTFRDFEVIISDDSSSSEESKKIIAEFPELNTKYVQNKTGRGIFNNLNNAIKNSRGDFIQIFCQDDIMLDFFLEKQLDTFDRFPSAGLVFSKFQDICSTSQPPSQAYMEEAMATWKQFIPKTKAFNYLFAFGCIPGNLSPVMLKRDVIEKTGSFNKNFPFGGDYEYWIRVAEHFDFAFNKEVSLGVRIHEKRASITLGLLKLIPDVAVLYKYLYHNNTVNAKKYKMSLQVNNLVVGHFKGIILNLLKGKIKYLKLLKYLHSSPFHISVIIILIFHRYIKGKVTWFISDSEC